MMGFIAGVSVTLIVLFILFVILAVRLKEHFDVYKKEWPYAYEELERAWEEFMSWSNDLEN